MTEPVPQPEATVPVDAAAEGEDQRDADWPQLSELDLDVCLSAALPGDRKPSGSTPSPPSRA